MTSMPYSGTPKLTSSVALILILISLHLSVTNAILDEGFDFIVVGGGIAGSVVAGRLSENGKYTVLVLEAGQIPDPTLDIPALSGNASMGGPNGDYVKIYTSVPQENVDQDNNGVVSYWAGWVLGGGSSVNMMVFNRGSPYDYDNWARKTGDASWSYRNMLKHFRRMEDYLGDYPSDQHGTGGPIGVSRPRYSPGVPFWLEAGKYLGYTSGIDQNGPQQISFTTVENNKRFGRRVSAYRGYLEDALKTRQNLQVITGALVSRILFEGDRAIGVVYKLDGIEGTFTALVRREVILSAGVIMSPSILLRSGVGPAEDLREYGIPLVKDLPVGKNLQDHVAVRLDFAVNNTHVFDTQRDLNPVTWKIYNSLGDGPYAAYGANAQFFIRSPQTDISRLVEPHENDQWPNLQGLLVFGGLGNIFYTHPPSDTKLAKWEGVVLITPFLTRPNSVGYLKLNTSDIEGDPILDFQYLTHPQDVEDLLHAIKFSLDVMEQTPSFGRIGARYAANPLPSCRHLQFRSVEYWRCFIRQTATSGHHGAGTCRMGSIRDPEAVVDTTLKVIGFKNLRVADTSIMPNVVNANTQVGAFVIGEKAADMILREHN